MNLSVISDLRLSISCMMRLAILCWSNSKSFLRLRIISLLTESGLKSKVEDSVELLRLLCFSYWINCPCSDSTRFTSWNFISISFLKAPRSYPAGFIYERVIPPNACWLWVPNGFEKDRPWWLPWNPGFWVAVTFTSGDFMSECTASGGLLLTCICRFWWLIWLSKSIYLFNVLLLRVPYLLLWKPSLLLLMWDHYNCLFSIKLV